MNKRNFFLQNVKARLLEDNVDIKNIETDRPYPALLDNVPIICIYSGEEDFDNRSGGGGNDFINDTYRNEFDINIDIIMDNGPGTDFKLNEISSQIEDSLSSDIFLEEISGEDQPNNEGLKIRSGKPYSFDVGAEKSYAAASTIVTYRYITDAIPKKRLAKLEGLDGSIIIGDEDTPPMEVEIQTNI